MAALVSCGQLSSTVLYSPSESDSAELQSLRARVSQLSQELRVNKMETSSICDTYETALYNARSKAEALSVENKQLRSSKQIYREEITILSDQVKSLEGQVALYKQNWEEAQKRSIEQAAQVQPPAPPKRSFLWHLATRAVYAWANYQVAILPDSRNKPKKANDSSPS